MKFPIEVLYIIIIERTQCRAHTLKYKFASILKEPEGLVQNVSLVGSSTLPCFIRLWLSYPGSYSYNHWSTAMLIRNSQPTSTAQHADCSCTAQLSSAVTSQKVELHVVAVGKNH